VDVDVAALVGRQARSDRSRPRTIPHYPRSQGLAEWWDSLMFMTTDARVRSSWSPPNPRAPRALVNPTDKVPLHWNRTSPPTNTPTSRKNTASTTNE
jgi:hypothetical protein